MSPVKAVGKRIIEVRTGKVVGTAKSPSKAKASARIRNQAHREKKARKR
jgi:hypothetical protein